MEHSGHRKRLVEKLEKGVLCEHEVLEALLFNAMPRKNTNDLAHRLLAQFGSVPAILDAPISLLKEVDGVGESVAAYLKCVGTFAQRYYAEYKERFPLYYEDEDFRAFVRREYTYLQAEMLDCYMVDRSGRILGRKRFTSCANDFADLPPDEFTSLLATKGTAGLVFVHNHPNGSCKPSERDNETTKRCQWLCEFHNLLLCEHIVCGLDGVYSYYSEGFLGDAYQKQSIRELLARGSYGQETR